MWKCKHCRHEYDFSTTSEKGNHTRWCQENPKRNDTVKLKKALNDSLDIRLGKKEVFMVKCSVCYKEMEIEERSKQHPMKDAYYCSRGCANSIGGKSRGITNYTTIAKRYNEHKCIVCGFDKILSVHHVNCNHDDNDKKNLVILCPNHHHMIHTIQWKDEIEQLVNSYLKVRWG